MANSTSNLDTISATQSGKETTANAFFDAASQSTLYGRRAAGCSGLTWAYYGGNVPISGVPTFVNNGSLSLAASSTNYVEANPADGVVSSNTTGFTSGYWRLYTIITGVATVTSWVDHRYSGMMAASAEGTGTVTSVDITAPAAGITATGGPVTTSGAITLALANDLAALEGLSGTGVPNRTGTDTWGQLAVDSSGSLGTSNSTLPTQGAVKAYVDAAVSGLSWKQSVRAATTVADTLATSFENGDTIDGVTLATGDRILIKNQATASENGIYIVAASGAPSRSTDADIGTELVNASCYVSEGTTNADTQWTCSTNAPITVGSTSLTFAQLTSGGSASPTTTKGDLIVRSATTDSRLPVGSDGQMLIADSTQSLGVRWGDVSSLPVLSLASYITAAGGNTQTAWNNIVADVVTLNGAIVQLPAGVTDFAGALQDTSGANAQLLLPSIDTATGKQITMVIRGVRPPPTAYAVVSSTPLPVDHSVLRSTLATGSGGNLLAGHCATSASNFTLLHLRLENFTLRMPANPTHSAADFSKVSNLETDGFTVDAGEYQAQAISLPTTSTSYGIKFPKNNNGADVRVGVCNVIGFYKGVQISEHFNAQQLNVWACRVPVETTFGYHASHIKRLMIVHCPSGIVATGGAAYLDIEQMDIEHAVSGWWAPSGTYDIDDSSNYLHGRVRWHTVKAGVGVDETFAVNGAVNFEYARVGMPFVPRTLTWTASHTATLYDAGRMNHMNVASANNFTVDPASSVKWPEGAELHVMQIGDGATTLVAGTGVTLNKPASRTLVLAEKGAAVTIKRRGLTDVWDVFGMLGAV